MAELMRPPLTRDQVIGAIERRGGGGIPLLMVKWWGIGLLDALGPALDELSARCPDDFCAEFYDEPGNEVSHTANPEYRFGYRDYDEDKRHGTGDAIDLLSDWADLDRFLAHFPNPDEPGSFDRVKEVAKNANGRYKLGGWWRLFHERMWAFRGMENLMIDYYEHMDELKILGAQLVAYYKKIIDRYHAMGFDGIFSSDDLGHQKGPMMSPAIFEELYLPLYSELIGYTHDKGMHFFLHSCGDNSLLMEYLIQAGLDVFHPVQKGCMDMRETAEKYGGRISFLAGMDVQHILVEGTPDDVRREVREMKSIFGRPDGGLLFAMGNGVMPGTPLENIEAALEEMAMA